MSDNKVIHLNEAMDVGPEVENVENVQNVENNFDEEAALDSDVRQKLHELRTMDINNYDPAWEPEDVAADIEDDEANDAGAVAGAVGEEVVVAGNFSEDESDSGCEEDRVVTENSELLRGISKTLTLREIRNDDNSYCANVSYFLVILVGDIKRKLCFFCFRYYVQRLRFQFGEYEHFQDHYKTKIEFDRYRQRCYLCETPLYEIHMTEVCATCHHHEGWV